MPFNTSGIFSRLYKWVSDRDADIPIDATKMDAEFNNYATAINDIVSQRQPLTGTVKGPLGTPSSPAFTFALDPNTGVYRSGEDEVAISAGGSPALIVNKSTTTISGTALKTPAIIEVGDGVAKATAALDFHSNGVDTTTDYDVRIASTGGTAGTSGKGNLSVIATQINAPTGTADLPGLALSGGNSGIYWNGVTGVGVSVAGVSKATIASSIAIFSIPLRCVTGSMATPALQFGASDNGIYWSPDVGPLFVANGVSIGSLDAGAGLSSATSIVTRQAGDARYLTISSGDARYLTQAAGDARYLTPAGGDARYLGVSDASVVKTSGNQTIAGNKILTGVTQISATSGELRIVKDATDAAEQIVMRYMKGTTTTFSQIISTAGDMVYDAQGTQKFRIKAAVDLDFGRGNIFLENNANDGTGTGLCVRSSVNPTGDGMILSVRSSSNELALGANAAKVMTGASEIFLRTADTGGGGNRVLHDAMVAGSVGQFVFAQYSGSAVVNSGGVVAGSVLRPTGTHGDVQNVQSGALSGTWRCLGYCWEAGVSTLFQRIS